ncbi:MAG TPA: LLM class flavin-dependent oxidoreductase [Acidimicrobiales bacterium]|nr:LLM class flavin-dependent oxidoreductase [Acidimicrobiales bacterium]
MKVRFAIAPGIAPGMADLEPMVRALEASGFDGIWLSDVPLAPVADPLLGLAFAAGLTSRLKLGANVVPLGRNPFALAKQLAQLDQVSGGRVLLAFVPGLDHRGEREALGVAGADRGAILEEVLAMSRHWWAGEEVSASTNGWSLHELTLPTRPLQEPLEVWLGGHGPRALERAGRIADGWLGAALTPPEADTARRAIQRSAKSAGRAIDPEHFGMSIGYARASPDPAVLEALRARRKDVDPLDVVPVGADSLRSMVLDYLSAGVSKFVLRPLRVTSSWDEELDWLGDAVLDLQS